MKIYFDSNLVCSSAKDDNTAELGAITRLLRATKAGTIEVVNVWRQEHSPHTRKTGDSHEVWKRDRKTPDVTLAWEAKKPRVSSWGVCAPLRLHALKQPRCDHQRVTPCGVEITSPGQFGADNA